jgi:hypothetical protein
LEKSSNNPWRKLIGVFERRSYDARGDAGDSGGEEKGRGKRGWLTVRENVR